MNFNNLTSMAIFCKFSFHNNGHDKRTMKTGELIPTRFDGYLSDYAICGSTDAISTVETYMPAKFHLRYQNELVTRGDDHYYYPKRFYDYYDGLMYELHVKFRTDFMAYMRDEMFIGLQSEIHRYRQWNSLDQSDSYMIELFKREIDDYLTNELRKITRYDCRVVENIIENSNYDSYYHSFNNINVNSDLYTILLSDKALDDLLINEKLSILDNDSRNFLEILQLLHNNKGQFNGT